MSPWTEKKLEEARKQRLKHLKLGFDDLETIPEGVRELTWLEALDISGNQIRFLPDWISELTELRGVVAFDNPLEAWPEGLPISAHWSVIDRLGVADEQVRGVALDWDLDALPTQLYALANLRYLDLGRWSNEEETPPFWIDLLLADIDQYFPQLEELDLFYCGLTDLPESVGRLSKLKELMLTGNPLGRLPEPIKQLAKLQDLSVDEAGLTTVPDWLFTLSDLRHLSLGFNQMASLPSAVRHGVRLESLSLAHTLLSSIPGELGMLQHLVSLDLGNTNLLSIPPEVFSLHRLRRLNLHGITPTRIHYARGEIDITHLNPAHGQITEISPDILKLTRLQNFDVSGQPITTPPEEVVHQGLDAIRDYWRQRAETGTDYLCEAKLLIVGEGGAGKSTLAAKVLDPDYRLDANRPSTEGIDILRWRFPSRIHPRAEGAAAIDRDFEVGIWDFGGQEIYHATHQFFLTRRSLYVLVADDRKEDTDFHYWLSVVELLAGDAPLVIVKNEKQDRRREMDEVELRRRFPNVKAILATNLQSNRGLDEVVRCLRHHLEGLPHIGDALPATWKRVREALETDRRDHITLPEFLALCGRHGFSRDKDKLQLSAYLHDLGICLHFQDDPVLKHTVILRPSWGTDAVYRVLDDAGVAAAYGHFTRADLKRIWDEPQHQDMEDELLRLMMKFQLCYELPDGAGFIAPQLLPAARPDYPWSTGRDLVLRWVYGFMPKGILTRLTVALHSYIADAGRQVWRSGVVLEQDGARCEAVEDYQRRQLVLRAQGPGRKVLLGIVHHELVRIHRAFPRLDVQTMVPCNCRQCAGDPDPHSFSFEVLQRAARERREIQCQRAWEMVDASSLIDAVFEREALFEEGQVESGRPERAAVRSTRGDREPPEVFVSYSWKTDVALVDTLAEALRGRGLPVSKDKDELRYKDSIREFMERLGRGKAVVVVLSEAYLRSHYCMFELIQISKARDLPARVFPIVLEPEAVHDPIRLLGHIQFWENRIQELDAAMKQVEGSNLEGIRENLDLYREIRATLARLTEVLADMNHLTPANHAASDFAELAEFIAARLATAT